MSRCRMYDHALRFIDDDDIIVLIDDIEWNILRLNIQFFCVRDLDSNRIAGPELVIGFDGFAIYGYEIVI